MYRRQLVANGNQQIELFLQVSLTRIAPRIGENRERLGEHLIAALQADAIRPRHGNRTAQRAAGEMCAAFDAVRIGNAHVPEVAVHSGSRRRTAAIRARDRPDHGPACVKKLERRLLR